MAVCKDENKNGTWYADFQYKDWTGNWKRIKKRGFKTKREAKAWEQDFKSQKAKNPKMTFSAMVNIYFEDMGQRLKGSTIDNKRNIVNNHILPYFGKQRLEEITAPDVRAWQNEIRSKGFSQTYIKSINNQFSAIMNYACRFYKLSENPVRTAGSMGKSNTAEEMKIWTKEEFTSFIQTVKEPEYHLLYDILFYTGLRIGEALVLTPSDFKEEIMGGNIRRSLTVSKTYFRKGGVTVYNTPKTLCSRREVTVPQTLWDEIQAYLKRLYEVEDDERIFPMEKNTVNKKWKKHLAAAQVTEIRIHDLRHSHASMLINMGKPILEVSKRLGHKTVKTTWDTYAHLYPGKDIELADSINDFMNEGKREEAKQSKESELEAMLSQCSAAEVAGLLAKVLSGKMQA